MSIEGRQQSKIKRIERVDNTTEDCNSPQVRPSENSTSRGQKHKRIRRKLGTLGGCGRGPLLWNPGCNMQKREE